MWFWRASSLIQGYPFPQVSWNISRVNTIIHLIMQINVSKLQSGGVILQSVTTSHLCTKHLVSSIHTSHTVHRTCSTFSNYLVACYMQHAYTKLCVTFFSLHAYIHTYATDSGRRVHPVSHRDQAQQHKNVACNHTRRGEKGFPTFHCCHTTWEGLSSCVLARRRHREGVTVWCALSKWLQSFQGSDTYPLPSSLLHP